MINTSYSTFKCRSIYNTTSSNFLQYQQVLVACYQIVGMRLNSKCQQIVIGFVSAQFNSLCRFKSLTYDLHKLNQRFNILCREILGKFRTGCNLTNLSKQFITNYKLNTLITQQIDKFGKSSTNKKTNPTISVNDDTRLSLSWHGVYVLQPLLLLKCPLQKSRLYGMFQEIGSVLHEWSGASKPYLYATENVLASAD